MNARRAVLILKHAVIFHRLAEDPLIGALLRLYEAEGEASAYEAAAAIARSLYPQGTDLAEAVFQRMIEDDNIYARQCAQGKQPDAALRGQLVMELEALSWAVEHAVCKEGYPAWAVGHTDFMNRFDARMQHVATQGYGPFASHRVFTVDAGGMLVPVRHPDPIALSDLYGYELERGKVLANTRALLSCLPASNMLLYGDAGTGKSSTVKAVANEFASSGLRLIQIEKQRLNTIPALLDELAENPLKFILFIDDLSFASGDGHFNALKTVLEGSVAARPSNVVVYATSNRRHLVSETFSARTGDEIHISDTLQEIAGLSARFGMIVTFGKPDKDEYIRLVLRLAKKSGLAATEDELIAEAEAFAIRSGGRSPRTARHYIDGRISMEK